MTKELTILIGEFPDVRSGSGLFKVQYGMKDGGLLCMTHQHPSGKEIEVKGQDLASVTETMWYVLFNVYRGVSVDTIKKVHPGVSVLSPIGAAASYK